MGDTKITSITVEVTHADKSASVVVRQPGSDEQGVYVAGDLPSGVAEEILRALNLDVAVAPASVRGGAPSSRQPSSPMSLASAELASSTLSTTSSESLANLLEELASAVLRTGRRQPTSTVDELLQRAWQATPQDRMPVARALACLEEGLEREAPAVHSACALAALGELVSALRGDGGDLRTELQNMREGIDPCTLVEVGRRRERGALAWETRLLLDLGSGNLYREEAAIGDRRLSRGTVGRSVAVTLGRRRAGLSPPRIEIQQYEYEPAASAAQLAVAATLAAPHLPELSRNGLELVLVPRPVWLAVHHLEARGGDCWLSTGDTTLPVGDGPSPGAIAALLEEQGESNRVRAVGGSLELHAVERAAPGEESRLVFVPWSALVEEGSRQRLLDLSA